MKFQRVLFFSLLTALFFSCKGPQKLPTYLQQVTDTTQFPAINIPELIIQKGDILIIQIMSLSTKPEQSDLIYNQPAIASAGQGGGAGYLVDNSGNILHHRLGLIHAEGMTQPELAAEIKKRLTQPVELLSDPTVVVRLTNFKVTMLGQVGKEGPLNVPTDKLTILEAVGLAGGVTDYGKKTGIKIFRESNGKREIGYIDLTSRKLFESSFYYLKQNDLVIVEETNKKQKDTEQARTIQKISFAFTLVTVAATMANIFIKN